MQAAPKKAARRPAPARRGPSPGLLAALFALAFALVPALAAAARAVRWIEAARPPWAGTVLGLSAPVGSFLAGGLAFALLFLFVRVPPVAYVAVHELTHALFGLLFGARVSRLRIGGEHGSVDVSRPNAVILLAPYFFPLPAAALLLLRGAVSLFVPLAGTVAGSLCAAAVGVAWGFHLCFTINALLQRQTDLDAYGFLFSVVFLALLNALFLFLSLSLLAPVPLADAFAALRMLLRDSYARCLGLGG